MGYEAEYFMRYQMSSLWLILTNALKYYILYKHAELLWRAEIGC